MRLTIKDDDSVQIELDQSGGGNPNYVETIEGTAANPWGDVNPAELRIALENNSATARITVDLSYLSPDLPLTTFEYSTMSGGSQLYFSVMNFIEDPLGPSEGGGIAYSANGPLSGAVAYIASIGSLDLSQEAEHFPTTLTIIHHPLPENNNT